MPVQISNFGNLFSMLRLVILDSITTAKMKYPIITDIINSGNRREMDNIINTIHTAITIIVCDIIVKFKKIKLIN